MTEIKITKEFILKQVESFKKQYSTLPKYPAKFHGYPPRDNKVYLIAIDVSRLHKTVLENFPELSGLLIPNVPSEEEISKGMGYSSREHYVESTLQNIGDAIESTYGITTSNSTKTIEYKLTDPNSMIENLFLRFHEVIKQLLVRHDDRETLEMGDEYDVQDLLHSLLKLYFDDVRPEEWNPSYAGSSTKVDFLIPDYNIVIECKKTRKGLGNKELKEELVMDKDQYKKNPKCKVLYCFVYDPEEKITNPRGFEKDLSETTTEFECKVFLIPRH